MSSKLLKNETWAIVSMSKRDADAVIKLAGAEDIVLPKTIITLDKNNNATIKGGATVDMGRKLNDLYYEATCDMSFYGKSDVPDGDEMVDLPIVYTSVYTSPLTRSKEISNELVQYAKFKSKTDSSRAAQPCGLADWLRWLVAYPLSVVGAIAIVGMVAGWTAQKPGGIEPQPYSLSGNETKSPSLPSADVPATPQRITVAGSQSQSMLRPVKSLEVIAGAASRPNRRLFVFSDPLCPYCKRLEPTLQSLSSRGYEIHIFPTPIHEQSIPMIAGVACAKDKVATWSAAIDKEQVANGGCADAKTASDDALAFFRQFGFNATPTMINDAGFTHVGGFASESELAAFIEKTN